MNAIEKLSQLDENIDYLEAALEKRDRRALDLIKRGTCFIVKGPVNHERFYPSRFAGYIGNSFEIHAANEDKDGRVTNPAISKLLSSEPKTSETLNEAYSRFCLSLGFTPNAAGSFGVERKFWDLRK